MQRFFERSALIVAKELVGKFLVRKIGTREYAFMITETEAYDGFKDKASHAYRGKTKRNEPMFGPAGYWYVYFTYGMHWMLNIVTGQKGYPAAALIRGVVGVNGPARLTKKLKIDKKFNGQKADKRNKLWIEDRGVKISAKKVKKTPRIGVAYAEEWAEKPYRYHMI